MLRLMNFDKCVKIHLRKYFKPSLFLEVRWIVYKVDVISNLSFIRIRHIPFSTQLALYSL